MIYLARLLLALTLMGAGIGIGWLLWGEDSSAHSTPDAPPVQVAKTSSVNTPARVLSLSPFEALASRIDYLLGAEQYEQVFDELSELSILANTPQEQAWFRRQLATYVDTYSRVLIEANRFQAVDELLEQTSLVWPQFSEYQLRLGKLRIQMGNGYAALAPLAQLSNHESYGVEARTLMAQIERSVAANVALEALPLEGRDGQFIVQAMIDDRHSVRLLVDTGAAMTAIDANVMRSMGYDLNTETQYFSTANGIVAAPVVSVQKFSLGSASISELSVGALALRMPGDVVGLLGMNFLRHYDFQIDQNNQTLLLDRR